MKLNLIGPLRTTRSPILSLAGLMLALGAVLLPVRPAGAQATTPLLEFVDEVAVANNHACALLESNSLRCWGDNNYGQLGDGTTIDSTIPVGVVGIPNATDVDVGTFHSCAVLYSGEVRCWGSNSLGRLGNGVGASSLVPVKVVGISDAMSVSVGGYFSCATMSDGTVQCWGSNSNGQLGDGTSTHSSVPVTVVGLSDAASTTVGIDAACALRNNGEVSCWGSNASGQLGDGTTTDSSVPVAVVGAANTAGVSAGASHACAVTGAAKVRCWGANSNGQLGDGTTTDSSLPVLVSGLTGVKTVAAGAGFSCAALTTGEARCWGSNAQGRLGDGTLVPSVTPVAVSGLTDATDVATGLGAGCASRRTEGVTCWGQNVEGQLGDGTTVDSPNRVDVIAGLCQEPPDPGFSDVPSGVYYTEAVAWLVGKAITTGTSPGNYSPTSTVSRAQMAVFLWRAAGEPAAATPHSFGDVVSGSYYEDAVSWLVEAGITTGTSPGVYSPEAAVSRAQMAVFLHRATGELEAAGPHGFTDVQSGSYYEAAVTWLASVGISDGTAPGAYSPFTDVNRAQMAVFLHRRGCGISVAAAS